MPEKCIHSNCYNPVHDQRGQCYDHAYAMWAVEGGSDGTNVEALSQEETLA
jgi:hypothetical protein